MTEIISTVWCIQQFLTVTCNKVRVERTCREEYRAREHNLVLSPNVVDRYLAKVCIEREINSQGKKTGRVKETEEVIKMLN